MISTFSTTKYVVGSGALKKLADYKGRKMALVVDAGIIGPLGLEQALYRDILEGAGVDYRVVCQVPSEPDMELLEEPIRAVRDYDPDVVVGIGGGASMDAAKALLVFLEHPDMTWERAVSQDGVGPFSGRRTLVAVPTTSGTGSETTICAVIKDAAHRKAMILSPHIRPDLAILDFDLVKSIPRKNVAYSGADALAHALEAAVSAAASPMVAAQGTAAATVILRSLKPSWDGDMEARVDMHVAATMAGSAIDNAITGMAHGMDGAGGDFGKPHGLMTGLILPYTMLYLGPRPVYSGVARSIGLAGDGEALCRGLVENIWKLYDEIEMPKTLREAGIPEQEYLARIPAYVERSMWDYNIILAPKDPTREELEELYRQIYYGI